MVTTAEAEAYLTADDVAGRLNCSRELIYRLVRTGQIPALKIGQKSVRLKLNDVMEALSQKQE